MQSTYKSGFALAFPPELLTVCRAIATCSAAFMAAAGTKTDIATAYLVRTNWASTSLSPRIDRCPNQAVRGYIIGEPLLSLHLAHLSLDEYARKSRTYQLIGVIQTGEILYNWESNSIPQADGCLPHYNSPRCFLAALISEYRRIGYREIALGGLLQSRDDTPTGLKFGLSPEELDELLTWSRPKFVLGELALTRIEVLRKHKVWADSTNWLWWDARYDKKRFGDAIRWVKYSENRLLSPLIEPIYLTKPICCFCLR